MCCVRIWRVITGCLSCTNKSSGDAVHVASADGRIKFATTYEAHCVLDWTEFRRVVKNKPVHVYIHVRCQSQTRTRYSANLNNAGYRQEYSSLHNHKDGLLGTIRPSHSQQRKQLISRGINCYPKHSRKRIGNKG
jgi:hypothetical protein